MSEGQNEITLHEPLASVGHIRMKVHLCQFDGFLGLAMNDSVASGGSGAWIPLTWSEALTLGAVLTIGGETIRDLTVRGGAGSTSLSTLFPWHEATASSVDGRDDEGSGDKG